MNNENQNSDAEVQQMQLGMGAEEASSLPLPEMQEPEVERAKVASVTDYALIGSVIWEFYRSRSQKLVSEATRNGQLPTLDSQSCIDCCAPAVGYEHRDYTRPLDVEPICRRCNRLRGPAELDLASVVKHLSIGSASTTEATNRGRPRSAVYPSVIKPRPEPTVVIVEPIDPNLTTEAARAMGLIGGQSKSKAKQAASRENGKKGGAPLKPLNKLSRSGLWRRKQKEVGHERTIRRQEM